MNAQEFWQRRSEFEGCELVNGEVVPTPPARFSHGRTESRIAAELERLFDADPDSTAELGTGVGYQIGEGTVRACDVCVHLDAMPDEDVNGWHRVAPSLVVEVVSPNDTSSSPPGAVTTGAGGPEMAEKIADWHRFGVREVWLANPKSMSVTLRRPGEAGVVFQADDTFETPLLPGFAVPTWRFFRRRR